MLVLVILLKQNFNFANLSLRSHRYLILYLRVGVLVGVIAIVAVGVGVWVGVCSGATTNGQDLDFGLRSLVWHISNATFAHQ